MKTQLFENSGHSRGCNFRKSIKKVESAIIGAFLLLPGTAVLFMVIHIKLKTERRPCRNPEIAKAKFPVNKIEIVMQSFNLVKFQESPVGCFIIPGPIGIAVFSVFPVPELIIRMRSALWNA